MPEQGTTEEPEGEKREGHEPDAPGEPAEQRDGAAASPVYHVGHRDPTDPERNDPVPLASPARRMRTIWSGLITATAAAISSALGVMLTLVVGPEPSRSTGAPPAAATPARGPRVAPVSSASTRTPRGWAATSVCGQLRPSSTANCSWSSATAPPAGPPGPGPRGQAWATWPESRKCEGSRRNAPSTTIRTRTPPWSRRHIRRRHGRVPI
jgi:hypothetical protein